MKQIEMMDMSFGMEWSDEYLLGYSDMDVVHKEFVRLVNNILICPDSHLNEALEQFSVHAVSHFKEEDQMMLNTDFPASECHLDEHAAVMTSLKEVIQELRLGNVAIARAFAKELASWFPRHSTHLDSALAHWMFRREHGGAPIVLKRLNTFQKFNTPV